LQFALSNDNRSTADYTIALTFALALDAVSTPKYLSKLMPENKLINIAN
jgi:hypothetical protein